MKNFGFFETLKITIQIFALCNSFSNSYAQDFSRMDIQIVVDGKALQHPFAGGLKAPQFSTIDLNQDQQGDLFVFDRSGDVLLPFIKTGSAGEITYRYAPEYISSFPKLENWALIRDFNQDGVPDIFSSSTVYPGCIEVWKGSRNSGGVLSFRRVLFSYGFPEILQFSSANQYVNIYCSSIDLPSVEDVDGDGDLDILSFDPDGTFATFFRNTSVEENLGLDSLKFVRADLCWGKFAENQFNESINLSNDPNTCALGITSGGNQGSRHAGSTLCLFDGDGDGDQDLLIGDLASSRIKKLINGGNKNQAYVTSFESMFPQEDNPAFIDIFLASYYLDVDGDGRRDLIICPNDAGNGETQNHIWLYTNEGTDASPRFRLVTKNFLTDEMVFVNSGSHPAFCDVNADGLTDLIVGTNGMLLKDGLRKNRMVLFLNQGTESAPAYRLSDPDYLQMSVKAEGTGRLAPTAGDLDSDGDPDLLVGDSFGQLFYFENTAGKEMPCAFSNPQYPWLDIFIGQNAKPAITDFNRDGLNDIVLGEKNNQLNLLINIGQKGSPLFVSNPGTPPNTTQLGKIFAGNDFFTQNGAPAFFNAKDGPLMILGTEAASLFTYSDLSTNAQDAFRILAHPTGNIYEGRKLTLSIADIDQDGYAEIAVGNERGGLAFYNTPYELATPSSIQTFATGHLRCYPNPSSGSIFIEDSLSESYHLTDLHGKFLLKMRAGWNDISQLKAGTYLLMPGNPNKPSPIKIVLLP